MSFMMTTTVARGPMPRRSFSESGTGLKPMATSIVLSRPTLPQPRPDDKVSGVRARALPGHACCMPMLWKSEGPPARGLMPPGIVLKADPAPVPVAPSASLAATPPLLGAGSDRAQ